MTDALRLAAQVLDRATRVVVFTGAGVSAESGVPTYRSGADGLWSAQNMERFANPAGYRRNLPDSYEWYRARAEGVRAVQPNPTHHAIARLARSKDVTLVTQNIDFLHQRAGSTEVIELHGHLRTARCDDCDWRVDWDQAPPDPNCAACGGMLRPEVVMFGEMLPTAALLAAQDAAARCDVLISVGTSNQVWPAAELPLVALRHGADVIVVNPDLAGQPTHVRVIGLAGNAGDVIPRLVNGLRSADSV